MELKLNRFAYHEHGTFGVLVERNFPICITLENQWKNNRVDLSCIPAGTYQIVRATSPKFGEVFEVQDVHGRTHIVIHWGNTEDDTLGCLLTGSGLGELESKASKEYRKKYPDVPPVNKKGITSSKRAFNVFMSYMEGHESAKLKIRDMSE